MCRKPASACVWDLASSFVFDRVVVARRGAEVCGHARDLDMCPSSRGRWSAMAICAAQTAFPTPLFEHRYTYGEFHDSMLREFVELGEGQLYPYASQL